MTTNDERRKTKGRPTEEWNRRRGCIPEPRPVLVVVPRVVRQPAQRLELQPVLLRQALDKLREGEVRSRIRFIMDVDGLWRMELWEKFGLFFVGPMMKTANSKRVAITRGHFEEQPTSHPVGCMPERIIDAKSRVISRAN